MSTVSTRDQQEAMALLLNCTIFPLAEHEIKTRGLIHKLACTIAENNLHAEKVISDIVHANISFHDKNTLNILKKQMYRSWQQKEDAIISDIQDC